MSFAQVATLLAWQLVLYGVGWLAVGALVRTDRGAVIAWGGFMGVLGTGFALAAQRDAERHWVAFVGSDIVFILAYILLQIGLDRFVGRREHDPFSIMVATSAVTALLVIGPGTQHASARVAVVFGTIALLGIRTLARSRREIRGEFGRGAGIGVALLGCNMIVSSGAKVVQQVADWSTPAELHRVEGNTPLLIGYLIGAALFNFGFMALLVLRLVDRLRRQSLEDPLTGLPNRRGLESDLQHAVRSFREQHQPFGVLVVDVDHFKHVNDVHGHLTGDLVLTQLGPRVRQCLRDGDVVARTGGEEFVLVVRNVDATTAVALAERLRRAICDHPFRVDGNELRITVSVGVAVATRGTDPETLDAGALMRRADEAMYAAKQAGRNRVALDGEPVSERRIHRPANEVVAQQPPAARV